MYTEKLCDNDSSFIHTIYTDLTVIITFLVTKYKKVSFRYLGKDYLPETKDLLSLSNSNDIVSHTSFESSPTRNKLVSPANNYRFHY